MFWSAKNSIYGIGTLKRKLVCFRFYIFFMVLNLRTKLNVYKKPYRNICLIFTVRVFALKHILLIMDENRTSIFKILRFADFPYNLKGTEQVNNKKNIN